MAFEFNKCCFCIDLRMGCLIIGYLNLIANIAEILMAILDLAATGVATAQSKDEEAHTTGAVMFAAIVIMLLIFFLFLGYTIVLLVGLHQYKRGHVKVYLIYTLILIVLFIIMFFTVLVAQHNDISAGMVIKNIVSILVSSYFLLVIRSYYLKMVDPTNNPTIYNTA